MLNTYYDTLHVFDLTGDTGSPEEGIPLQTSSLATGPAGDN